MMGIKCKLVEDAGQRFYLRVFWGGKGTHGREYGYHNAMRFMQDYPYNGPITNYEEVQKKFACTEITTQAEHDEYRDKWPTKCTECEAIVPAFQVGASWAGTNGSVPAYQLFYATLYREIGTNETPRLLQEGDMFWAWWMPTDLDKRGHLMVVCPGKPLETQLDVWNSMSGRIWDTMSTATNCGHGAIGNHYCWTRVGEPPNCSITPSILIAPYHGYLTNGELTSV